MLGTRNLESNNHSDTASAVTTIRLAVGFVVFALMATIVLLPLANNRPGPLTARAPLESLNNVDQTVTGSVEQGGTTTYTIRRSVLQPTPESECIIYADGTREGEC